MAQCKHFFHEPFVSTTAIAWLIMFEWQHNSLYKWQVFWRIEEKLVCKKDNFGNDRWFFDEDIRLPPLPPGLPQWDRLNYIRNLDLRPDDVIIAGYPRSGKTIETFALQIQISLLVKGDCVNARVQFAYLHVINYCPVWFYVFSVSRPNDIMFLKVTTVFIRWSTCWKKGLWIHLPCSVRIHMLLLRTPQRTDTSSHLSNLAFSSHISSSRTCLGPWWTRRSRSCTSRATSRMSLCLCIASRRKSACIIPLGQSSLPPC